jgi:hypothetical protein
MRQFEVGDRQGEIRVNWPLIKEQTDIFLLINVPSLTGNKQAAKLR